MELINLEGDKGRLVVKVGGGGDVVKVFVTDGTVGAERWIHIEPPIIGSLVDPQAMDKIMDTARAMAKELGLG